MTLFPGLDNNYYAYYGTDDQGIKERMEATYAQAITINQSFWSEADIDTRFKAGDQTLNIQGVFKLSLMDLEAYGESYGDRAQAA